VLERESQIVLGLDPSPGTLWPGSGRERARGTPGVLAGGAVIGHCRTVIDATAQACVAVKLQLACFERLGTPGWSALEAVAAHARDRGLLVIADAKRGDIPTSAAAYAQAFMGGMETPFGPVRGLGADLLTVNPLMGQDSLAPFVEAARAAGGGVLTLVRTSNQGAADIEDLKLEGGEAVWERLAGMVDELGRPGVGESGLSDVGAVVAATAPNCLQRARELMDHATFLLPGVGAQGGRVEELAPAFLPGRAGGLVAASRAIVNAHEANGADPAAAALAEAERLREAAWTLSGQVRIGG
jgi:orotidine-5'-phosphate decarboxylase